MIYKILFLFMLPFFVMAEDPQNTPIKISYSIDSKFKRQIIDDYVKANSKTWGAVEAYHKLHWKTPIERHKKKQAHKDHQYAYWEPGSQEAYTLTSFGLGEIYFYGSASPIDYPLALQNYIIAFIADHSEAANKIGLMFRDGLGLSKDKHKAVTLFQIASQQGNVHAKLNLAEMYEEEYQKTQDKTYLNEAITLYRQISHSPKAQNHLGVISALEGQDNAANMFENISTIDKEPKPNDSSFFGFIVKAEHDGFDMSDMALDTNSLYAISSSKHNLALMHLHGLGGVSQDKQKAIKLFKEAHKKFNAKAPLFLYLLSDKSKELAWFKKYKIFRYLQVSAARKDSAAQNLLGIKYKQSPYVMDYFANRLFALAADKGLREAQYNVSLMHLRKNTPAHFEKAFEWMQKSAKQGFPPALDLLGWMYANNSGAIKKSYKGLEYLKKNFNNGYKRSGESLGHYYFHLGDYKNSEYWFQQSVERFNDQHSKSAMRKLLYNQKTSPLYNLEKANQIKKELEASGYKTEDRDYFKIFYDIDTKPLLNKSSLCKKAFSV